MSCVPFKGYLLHSTLLWLLWLLCLLLLCLLLPLLQDVSLLGADPVIWLTFGVTHFVRPEDAPVMPCDQVRRQQACMLYSS